MCSICRRPFALDKSEQVGLTSMEVGMCKLDGFSGVGGAHKALLEGRDLAETVEIELTDKGREVLVFEPFSQNFPGKSFVVVN